MAFHSFYAPLVDGVFRALLCLTSDCKLLVVCVFFLLSFVFFLFWRTHTFTNECSIFHRLSQSEWVHLFSTHISNRFTTKPFARTSLFLLERWTFFVFCTFRFLHVMYREVRRMCTETYTAKAHSALHEHKKQKIGVRKWYRMPWVPMCQMQSEMQARKFFAHCQTMWIGKAQVHNVI